MSPLKANEIEAANRAEVTALLIRGGYRVYRPEADVDGEDLVLRTPAGQLIAVQLKGRLYVDLNRYGGPDRSIWMLFPNRPYTMGIKRDWFLVPHDTLFEWLRERHGHTPKWQDRWGGRNVTDTQKGFLMDYLIKSPDSPV